MSHTRLAILRNIKSMLRARNKTLPNPTMLNNNGIQIHGGLVLEFFTTIPDGVQGVLVMDAHSTKPMFVIPIEYPIFVRNDGILAILVENNSFYNRVRTKPIQDLEGNQYNGFKAIPTNHGAKKLVVVGFNVEILVNLLSKTHLHNIVTIKSIPPNLRRDLLEPPRGVK
jgi:hypothetical protein